MRFSASCFAGCCALVFLATASVALGNPIMGEFSEATQFPDSPHGQITFGSDGYYGSCSPVAVELDGTTMPNPMFRGGSTSREGGSGVQSYELFQVCLCDLDPGAHQWKWIYDDNSSDYCDSYNSNLAITDPAPSGSGYLGIDCAAWCDTYIPVDNSNRGHSGEHCRDWLAPCDSPCNADQYCKDDVCHNNIPCDPACETQNERCDKRSGMCMYKAGGWEEVIPCDDGLICDNDGMCVFRDPAVDGDEPDGDEPDGDEPDGDAMDGDEPDGDAVDGDTPQQDGDEADGDSPEADGDEPDGDSDDEGNAADNDDDDGGCASTGTAGGALLLLALEFVALKRKESRI